MDDIVRQAMAKWPNVPDCFGWLGLDQRGQWWMRDAQAQACGAFQSGAAGSKGSILRHEKLIEFIGRNYEADAQGRWYFQNGPQRVYVELECTPWIWRLQDGGQVSAHTGKTVQADLALLDEHGRLYLHTNLGLGLVHTLDVVIAASLLEKETWPLQNVQKAELSGRFAYQLSPQQT
jgi:hypothetical protein